jgi:hypothetical protein
MENQQGIEARDDIFPRESTPQERRRYALLQASATILAHNINHLRTQPDVNAAMFVGIAEELLDEIERREK